ncbi:hypothetical protein HanRHA438_Chr09g0402741 [Helianthus annuus]|nr:hypothetical protein HanIR_Chr09g0421871 [Helianthus annuus]KAJ0616981.1 hypothetical protein HanIR_Chr02g0096491 [Helianthus annuus]KAJ0888507.1 hypothetical protein HanRHA438_Chr09g0402741 [Helianthus annuus]
MVVILCNPQSKIRSPSCVSGNPQSETTSYNYHPSPFPYHHNHLLRPPNPSNPHHYNIDLNRHGGTLNTGTLMPPSSNRAPAKTTVADHQGSAINDTSILPPYLKHLPKRTFTNNPHNLKVPFSST